MKKTFLLALICIMIALPLSGVFAEEEDKDKGKIPKDSDTEKVELCQSLGKLYKTVDARVIELESLYEGKCSKTPENPKCASVKTALDKAKVKLNDLRKSIVGLGCPDPGK